MAIVLTGIEKVYGTNRVLDQFSCRFEENAVTCIMGPSGRGKTTLLRILLGLEPPDGGQLAGLEGLRKSAVFQEDRLCEHLSALSNIRLVCPKQVKTQTIIDAMGELGLDADSARQPAHSMSGGQRRRVAILRALMAESDILVMDEPFKGLDAKTKASVVLYTKEKSRGKTVILVTHDQTECEIMGGVVLEL